MEEQLSFLLEIDKLKNVVRQSPLVDQSRKENSAEHSWHLAMYALVLADSANAEVNIDRVIRMLLIHDIVEIDAGDHPLHASIINGSQNELEQRAAKRIFGILPEGPREELMQLWQEFEAGKTHDAAFAKCLDRLQPLIHNVAAGGGTWLEANVTREQVLLRYGPAISAGSNELWRKAEELIDGHFGKTL